MSQDQLGLEKALMGAEGLCTLQGAGALNLQGFEGLTEAAAPDEAPQALNPALPSVSFEWETVRCELINRIRLPNFTKPNLTIWFL